MAKEENYIAPLILLQNGWCLERDTLYSECYGKTIGDSYLTIDFRNQICKVDLHAEVEDTVVFSPRVDNISIDDYNHLLRMCNLEAFNIQKKHYFAQNAIN